MTANGGCDRGAAAPARAGRTRESAFDPERLAAYENPIVLNHDFVPVRYGNEARRRVRTVVLHWIPRLVLSELSSDRLLGQSTKNEAPRSQRYQQGVVLLGIFVGLSAHTSLCHGLPAMRPFPEVRTPVQRVPRTQVS